MDRLARKLDCFASFAMSLADLSTCRRAKVGALAFTPWFDQVLAIGYNGQPSGSSHDDCLDVEGACGCVHAEVNVIAKLATGVPCVLLTTTFPCPRCCSLIANVRSIIEVVYLCPYRDVSGVLTLGNAGCPTSHIGDTTRDRVLQWRTVGPRY